MRSGTSGLLFTQYEDNSVRIEVVDYGVDEFDGRDWECVFTLDTVNAEILHNELCKLHEGAFEEMLVAEFGKDFDILAFKKFCNDRNIKYGNIIWP